MSNKVVGSAAARPRSIALNKPGAVFRRPKLRRAFTANTGKELYTVSGSGNIPTKDGSMSKLQLSPLESEVRGAVYVLSPTLKASTLKRNDNGNGIMPSANERDPALKGKTSVELANGAPQKDSNNSSGKDSNNSSGVLSSNVREVVYKILSTHLENTDYNHDACGEKCRLISQTIEDGVKSLCSVQYKITAQVFIGAIRDQGMDVSSQCVWNPVSDGFAMATYKNESLFASGIVFATVYDE